MEETRPCGSSSDPAREWEIRNIIGQKVEDGKVHYRVDWEPTWMPESELHKAEDLIDQFVSQLQCARLERRYVDFKAAKAKRGGVSRKRTSGPGR